MKGLIIGCSYDSGDEEDLDGEDDVLDNRFGVIESNEYPIF